MLKVTEKTISDMEEQHPGITETIMDFETMNMPECPFCGSKDTASVQAGIIGRTIYLAGATTRFHLLPNNPDHFRLFCNSCRKYSKTWNVEPAAPVEHYIYSEQELRFTAMLYASRDWVLEELKKTGRLPDSWSLYGFTATIRELDQKRGRNIQLTENEQMVYDAIKREKRLPGGGVHLLPDQPPVFSQKKPSSSTWQTKK